MHELEAVSLSPFDLAAWMMTQTPPLVSRPVKGRAGYRQMRYPLPYGGVPISKIFMLISELFAWLSHLAKEETTERCVSSRGRLPKFP